MTGIYQHSVDAKGRLFIPARLRDELGDVFYVTISTEKCLSAYSNESWESFTEKIKSRSTIDQKKVRALFSHATRCEVDGQGRILLPKAQREHAGLKKDVTVVGVGGRAEFWDSEEWAAVDAAETSPENIAAVFMELDI